MSLQGKERVGQNGRPSAVYHGPDGGHLQGDGGFWSVFSGTKKIEQNVIMKNNQEKMMLLSREPCECDRGYCYELSNVT